MLVFLLIYQITYIIKSNIKTIDVENSMIVDLFLYLKTENVQKSHIFRNMANVTYCSFSFDAKK